eukprot:g2188.t1
MHRPPTPFHTKDGYALGHNEKRVKDCDFVAIKKPATSKRSRKIFFDSSLSILFRNSAVEIRFDAEKALRDAGSQDCLSDFRGDVTFNRARLREVLTAARVIEPRDGTGDVQQCKVIRSDFLPMDMLLNQDIPMLFYDHIPLYEGQVADGKGTCSTWVKVRAHEDFFVVLICSFSRINGEVRLVESLLFHDFSTDTVLRESTIRETTSDFATAERARETIQPRIIQQETISVSAP